MSTSVTQVLAKMGVEGFTGMQSSERRRDAYVEFLTTVIAFVLAIVLLAFIGKYLWNNVVVDLFNFAKPAKSLWQIVGLMVFWNLIK
jgi:hypothetical protein